jgi:hypothetical protein
MLIASVVAVTYKKRGSPDSKDTITGSDVRYHMSSWNVSSASSA